MEDFDVKTKEAANGDAGSKRGDADVKERATEFFRRLILFVCCGPGVVGFLWLIGRILRR
jgi:hypothetical protein